MNKTILVISDLHLGAGRLINGRRNFLEDFHCDKELIDFLNYYSSGEYADKDVELVINGDFFDFLAIPFVEFFDDEYWSEEAALQKMQIILKAHQTVVQAMNQFLAIPHKKINYMLGNHDAELVFESVRQLLIEQLGPEQQGNFSFITSKTYAPVPGIVILHGHEYELAHRYDFATAIISSSNGRKYFLPPWGSYYVTRIVNKYKEERPFINSVRPIRSFVIYGLIFDTLFTLRFIFANAYYFLMVIVVTYFRGQKNSPIKKVLKHIYKELELFKDYEFLTRSYFTDHPGTKALIVGHTHDPTFTTYADGAIFINTGTWTRMCNFDLDKRSSGHNLTFAQIELPQTLSVHDPWGSVCFNLYCWEGTSTLPYSTY